MYKTWHAYIEFLDTTKIGEFTIANLATPKNQIFINKFGLYAFTKNYNKGTRRPAVKNQFE